MFLFQSIPSFQIGFGFAIELFVIFFGFLCWLISPTPNSNPLVAVEEKTILSASETDKATDFNEANTLTVNQPKKKQRTATVSQLQKACSVLKDKKLISESISGKRKSALIDAIKTAITADREAVSKVLTSLNIDLNAIL